MIASEARHILEEAHAHWAAGRMDEVMQLYTKDCIYCSFTGGLEGRPMIIEGNAAFRAYLTPIMKANETVSTVINFSYSTGIGRARIAIYIKHRLSGHEITTTYRQIVTYRDNRLLRVDEYHDVARLSSFWRLAESEGKLKV